MKNEYTMKYISYLQMYVCLIAALFLLYGCTSATLPCQPVLADVLHGFENPQDSTRTKVWWFHGETETTREGITADLEAFRHAGVGGVVYYDQVHSKKTEALDAFSDEWWSMLYFAAREAERLGLSFEAHVSNGFVAGGPWITEELGMQMLAATDTLVHGRQSFCGRLSLPQNKYNYYHDVAVLAFPVSGDQWIASDALSPVITSNLPNFPAAEIFSKYGSLVWIPAQIPGRSVYLNLDFGKRFTARSITYQVRPRGKATTSATNVPAPPGDVFVGTGYQVLPDLGELEVSDDGIHYTKVCTLTPIYKAHSSWKQKTVSFPAVTGRYFRLNLHDWYMENDSRRDIQLGNVVLSPQAKVDQWEEKAGLFSEYIEKDHTPSYRPNEVIDRNKIVDISQFMKADGTLSWNVPAGDWVIMRFVNIPTGGKIKHGRANLMGLECDKMSVASTKVQWNNYFKVILDSLAKHGLPLHGMAMDSHEAGSQNWTPGFDVEFLTRRGYDLKGFLPAMLGHVVGSSEESDGVLYDVRRTIADLISDNYYGTLNELCREAGVHFTAQATGNALCIVADPIQAKGKVDIPQGEFWAIHPDGNYDIKESASAAHIYGKKIASAEAFTDVKFSQSLAYMKSLADYAYCYGINEFVVCASAYQPWLDKLPGSTGGGRHYCLNRNNTYWDYSKPFWDYQARCAYMMRQGMPVVDLCIYLGENAPVKILTHRLPDIPGGYDFDAFTSDALFNRMSVKDGMVSLPDGMSYRMMILPRNGELTLAALRKIAALVKRGVKVYGHRAIYSGSYTDIAEKEEYKTLVEKLWGSKSASSGINRYGEGAVCWGMTLTEALKETGLKPDVQMNRGDMKKDKIWFAHRRLKDADVYFLNNHTDQAVADTFSFRALGKVAELWNPVTGLRYALPSTTSGEGMQVCSLAMAPREAYFVFFSEHKSGDLSLPLTGERRIEKIEGTWNVYFDPKMGGPGEVRFDELTDWTLNTDTDIRYYSGTAVYRKVVNMQQVDEGGRLFLQFPILADIARIRVNGHEAGIVWCSPWQIDITDWVLPGENKLEIEVANSLMNRMTGDASLPQAKRITYAVPEIASPEDELLPSGIIGDMILIYYRK